MSATAAGIVRLLWERIQARDWDGARELLAEGMVCHWPHSDERFEGADDFIEMNRAYPEGWQITVLEVAEIPGGAVSRIHVDQSGTRFHAASFFAVRDGLIEDAVEYWVTEGSEEPPEWRARFSQRGAWAAGASRRLPGPGAPSPAAPAAPSHRDRGAS